MKKIAVGSLGEFWYGDYKEPFTQLDGAIPGYPQGVILKADDGKLLCPYCGQTYDNLGAHAAKRHGLPALEFKTEVGLLRGSALVSEKTRQLNSANGIRLRAAGHLRNLDSAGQAQRARLAGLVGGHGTRTLEALNRTGRCYAQVIATAKSVRLEYGRITQARMWKHGIHARIIESYFGTWEKFLRASGDSVANRSGLTWTDGQLVTVLRSVAQKIGHTPTVSDMRRYGMPTRRAYVGHFGSWVEACKRADILPRVPGEWARREITDQERIAVLSGYAMTGTMARAAKIAGISCERAITILGTFGIAPIPQESPLRRGQMFTAAQIARRIAGWPDESAIA